MEPVEQGLLDRYRGALGAFLARPQDQYLRGAYDDSLATLGDAAVITARSAPGRGAAFIITFPPLAAPS